jgi:hypothetical protein
VIFRRGSCNHRPQCSDADAETPRDLNARMARGDFLVGNRNLTRVQLRRPADPRAAFARRLHARLRPLADQLPLEFREHGQHPEQHPSFGARRVDHRPVARDHLKPYALLIEGLDQADPLAPSLQDTKFHDVVADE